MAVTVILSQCFWFENNSASHPHCCSVPLVPEFTATRLTATEISVDIEPLILPEERRGEITSYHVLWKLRSQNTLNCGKFTSTQIMSSLNTSFTLLNLDPGQEYCVTVSAETSAGVGNYSTAKAVERKKNQ